MDTIAFVLTGKELTIKKPEFFKPDYNSIANPQLLRTKFLLNKIKSLNNKIRITAIPRYADGTLTVNHTLEVSLPKLIKGNNIEEIDERHWEYLQRAIIDDLAKVCVEINVRISQLRVTKVHIGKNILLPAHIYLSEEIEKLSKLAPPPHFELSVVQYHPGKMVKMHSRLIEIVFYDKTQEVLQDKRIDKEFKQFITEQKLNIFRIEVRLNKKQNIISVLKQLGIPYDQITFEFLYSSRLWKQVILLYLTKVFLSQKYMLTNKEETDILRRLLLTDQRLTITQVLRAVGFYYEAKNKGLSIIRSDIERGFGRKGWYSTAKDRGLLNNAIAPQDIEEFYQIVFEQVNKWESIELPKDKKLDLMFNKV